MNCIAVLQNLYRQFPKKDESIDRFSRVEKNLQKKLGFTKALFVLREKEGLKTIEGKNAFPGPVQKAILRHLKGVLKPWIAAGGVKTKWLGFWPVVVGNEWIAGYWLGRKINHKGLTDEEKKLMEILADRTAFFLEERHLGQCLKRADRLSSMGFMASAMVHEIRNPLTALATMVQLLPQKKADERFMESFQKLMLREINHLTSLTQTFLSFSKPGLERADWVDLSLMVNQVTQLLGPLFATKRVQLKSDNKPGVTLRADEHQMESLIMNLLQNAFESVASQGIVEITTTLLRRSNKGHGSWVELRVKDNGTGISSENLGKIFDPYFSTKGEGAGLGLVICQKVVENHHGHMTAKSGPKKGTLFTVRFPASPKH